jgi:hypothetical protein
VWVVGAWWISVSIASMTKRRVRWSCVQGDAQGQADAQWRRNHAHVADAQWRRNDAHVAAISSVCCGVDRSGMLVTACNSLDVEAEPVGRPSLTI